MEFPFRRPRKASLILILLTLWAEMSRAQPCREWSAIKQLGSLPFTQVREASGLCMSLANPRRAYWVNDSGNKTQLFFGELNGGKLTPIDVKGFKALDSEALLAARCQDGQPCLVLGDIGDNFRRRKNIRLALFKDLMNPPSTLEPLQIVELLYPDEPRDAEAMFIGDNDDLFIVTKEMQFWPPGASAARVYRVPKKVWQGQGENPFTLVAAGEIDLPVWLSDRGFLSQVVTDASVNRHRNVLGLLTYGALIEVPLEKLKALKDTGTWQRNKDYFLIPIKNLSQQETVTYTTEDRVIWSSEFFPPQSPIFSMTCQRFEP